MTEARIICDSISPRDHRLTTFIVTAPRFILAEINTHRAFSRNAASSRAIPVAKMLAAVKDNPAMPAWWGKNEAGMVANAELSEEETIRVDGPMGIEYQSPRGQAREEWLRGRDLAIQCANALSSIGLHKQIANRVIEPWAHVTDLISATDWDNFFALRAHPDAQPEFRELAFKMLDLYNSHQPTPHNFGGWHIPFGDRMPEGLTEEQRLKVATARAARLSYLTFEGDIDVAKDCELHDRLLASGHLSPFEHCAQAAIAGTFGLRYGNFTGWRQYRHTLPDENRTDPRVRKWTYAEVSQSIAA